MPQNINYRNSVVSFNALSGCQTSHTVGLTALQNACVVFILWLLMLPACRLRSTDESKQSKLFID